MTEVQTDVAGPRHARRVRRAHPSQVRRVPPWQLAVVQCCSSDGHDPALDLKRSWYEVTLSGSFYDPDRFEPVLVSPGERIKVTETRLGTLDRDYDYWITNHQGAPVVRRIRSFPKKTAAFSGALAVLVLGHTAYRQLAEW